VVSRTSLVAALLIALPLPFLFTHRTGPRQSWRLRRAIGNLSRCTTAPQPAGTVVYPEVKGSASGCAHPRNLRAHGLAKEMQTSWPSGLYLIAPDLLSGSARTRGGSSEFPAQDAAIKAVSGLDPDRRECRPGCGCDYGKKLPAADGKIALPASAGGGGKSSPSRPIAPRIYRGFSCSTVLVRGCFHHRRRRSTASTPRKRRSHRATVPATTAMKAAGKTYDPITYDGAAMVSCARVKIRPTPFLAIDARDRDLSGW